MNKCATSVALSQWQDAPIELFRQFQAVRMSGAHRLEVGQRFHRVGLSCVVWRVARVYRDGQSVEHAILASNRRDLDTKTLSAAVLLNSKQYRQL